MGSGAPVAQVPAYPARLVILRVAETSTITGEQRSPAFFSFSCQLYSGWRGSRMKIAPALLAQPIAGPDCPVVVPTGIADDKDALGSTCANNQSDVRTPWADRQ